MDKKHGIDRVFEAQRKIDRIGDLCWVTFSDDTSDGWLASIESYESNGDVYVYFYHSWKDATPHGGGLYPRTYIHPMSGMTRKDLG